MKTLGLVVVVAALHCAVLGSVFFISGCGTTPKAETTSLLPAMPSPTAPQKPSAPVAPAPPEVKLPGTGGEYIVQPGDSISVIARRCHVTQAELIAVNRLSDPNKIRAGQKLILPASGTAPSVAAPSKPVAKAKPKVEAPVVVAGANEYVVQPGDNLSKIAARHGVKVSALREANKLQSDKLLINQKLIIPPAPSAAPAEPPAPLATPAPEPETNLPAVESQSDTSTLTGSGIVHLVLPDEDLISIAKLYAVTVEEIAELNQLSLDRPLQAGQRLKIP